MKWPTHILEAFDDGLKFRGLVNEPKAEIIKELLDGTAARVARRLHQISDQPIRISAFQRTLNGLISRYDIGPLSSIEPMVKHWMHCKSTSMRISGSS